MEVGIIPIDNLSLSSAYLALTRQGESVQNAKDKAEVGVLSDEASKERRLDIYA